MQTSLLVVCKPEHFAGLEKKKHILQTSLLVVRKKRFRNSTAKYNFTATLSKDLDNTVKERLADLKHGPEVNCESKLDNNRGREKSS